MKVYISADIEGVAGVVSTAQTLEQGFEYERARVWMTNEVIAACEGAKAAGAEEVIVSDSHGNGQSILVDKLPEGVRLVRNWPRPLGMMQGVETEGVACAFLLGYHTGAHHSTGVLAHTASSLLFSELRLNGRPASETTFSTAIAGHFNVPIVFASGDDAYMRHVEEEFDGPIETVETKTAAGRYSALTLTPKEACAMLRTSAEKAVALKDAAQPQKLDGPIVFEADFQRHLPAEVLAYLPCVDRTGPYTISFTGQDMVSVSKFLSLLTAIKVPEFIP
ncbi:MAG: M55 family metallopeptidase [Pseudomonadota bacterium]